jgi:hypothetical protein
MRCILVNFALLALSYLVFTVHAEVANTIVNLASLDAGDSVLSILGGQNSHTGTSVANCGDFNGDGLQDFIIGAPNQGLTGCAFIFLGGMEDAPIDAEQFLSGANGLKIIGASIGDQLGAAVGGAGDINDDGFDDCLVGAPGAGTLLKANAGIVYVIYGKAGPYTDILLSLFTSGSLGFKIIGDAPNSHLGSSPACLRGALGDINGDGIGDFAIGSMLSDIDDKPDAGAVYVIYGHAKTTVSVTIDLAISLGQRGWKVCGADSGDMIGSAISGAGDINGDGINDLLIGCTGCDSDNKVDAGAAYLIYCAEAMVDIDLSGFTTGETGVKLIGGSAGDLLGSSVCNAGDLNGDGVSDLVVGAPGTVVAGIGAAVGCVHVLYGSNTPYSQDFDVSGLAAGTIGYTVCGLEVGAKLGTALAIAGDINIDGIDDLLIGAGGNDGCAYVVPGLPGIRPDDVDLEIDADICIILPPCLGSGLGLSLDGGLDLSQGGAPGLLLGTGNADSTNVLDSLLHPDGGATYIVQCNGHHRTPTLSPATWPTAKPTKGPPPHPVSSPVSNPASPPTNGPPTNGPPTNGPPTNGPPTNGPPTNGPPTNSNPTPTKKPTKGPPPHPVSPPAHHGPTFKPTRHPTRVPGSPTVRPTAYPTRKPTTAPTGPTVAPTVAPTPAPTTDNGNPPCSCIVEHVSLSACLL